MQCAAPRVEGGVGIGVGVRVRVYRVKVRLRAGVRARVGALSGTDRLAVGLVLQV